MAFHSSWRPVGGRTLGTPVVLSVYKNSRATSLSASGTLTEWGSRNLENVLVCTSASSWPSTHGSFRTNSGSIREQSVVTVSDGRRREMGAMGATRCRAPNRSTSSSIRFSRVHHGPYRGGSMPSAANLPAHSATGVARSRDGSLTSLRFYQGSPWGPVLFTSFDEIRHLGTSVRGIRRAGCNPRITRLGSVFIVEQAEKAV